MRKFFLLLVPALVLFVGLTVAVTARYDSAQPRVPPASEVAISGGAAERLAGALRIRTISSEDPAAFDGDAFRRLHAYLHTAFPRVHTQLQRETVGTHSLLYTWRGSDSTLKPILLIGHLDVVPVETGAVDKWHHDPFSGRIVDGFIWGRGAIDNKSAVLGTLEAVEMLLAEGFQPVRTVHLAYGHDEEVGGAAGAREIAAVLKARGVELEMVLDEGGVIGEGLLPGIAEPVALVGTAEKGFVTIELSTRVAGGHSSLPPRQSAVGILSAAVARLEENPMGARLEGPTRQLFDRIGPRFPTIRRALFANLWLTAPLVLRSLEQRPTTNAMVRTTAAPTIFQAGTKDNVLPSDARAVINYRILPGDTIATVVEHVRRALGDSGVEVKIAGRFSAEPSAVSTTDSESFRTLERTIRSVVPDAIVAPYLVVVSTDARYYAGLSRNVYRFLPLRLTARDLERMHGIDERIGTREYDAAIRFYRQLVLEAAGSSTMQELAGESSARVTVSGATNAGFSGPHRRNSVESRTLTPSIHQNPSKSGHRPGEQLARVLPLGQRAFRVSRNRPIDRLDPGGWAECQRAVQGLVRSRRGSRYEVPPPTWEPVCHPDRHRRLRSGGAQQRPRHQGGHPPGRIVLGLSAGRHGSASPSR